MNDLVFAVLVALAAGIAVTATVYLRRSAKLARLFFALPAETRRKLIAKPSLLKLGGETRTITYLSCRIANAAEIELAYRGQPAQLIRLFEARLGAFYDAVLEHGGVVEHFGSAGFAAFWNAPLSNVDHAKRAAAAAAHMLRLTAEQNALPLRRPLFVPPPLRLAIGLATGQAATGLFGGAYSVAGACVLRAEALRAAAADYGFAALTDAETAAAAQRFALLKIDRAWRSGGETNTIYALLGDEGMRASPTFRALSTYHDRIFTALDAQSHDDARRLIAEASALSSASKKLYDLYAARDLRAPLKQAS